MRTRNDITAKINKELLVARLKENLKKHEAAHQKAVEVFRKKAIHAMEDRIACLREKDQDGVKPRNYLRFQDLPAPKSYADVYRELLELLAVDERMHVELNASQYRCWWKDRWEWKADFEESNSRYLGE